MMGWYIAVSVCVFFGMKWGYHSDEEAFILAVVWGPALVLALACALILWFIIAKHSEKG